MASVYISIKLDQNTKACGTMIYNMEMAKRFGQTANSILAATSTVFSMATASGHAPMAVTSKDNGKMARCQARASINGPTAWCTKATGKIIKCTVRAS